MALANGYPASSIQAFAQSFSMIIISEIGDKTFLIAAILAMRHLRLAVFLGAFLSLFLMSFLSASLGQILPALIPRGWTQWCASALFLIFGMKMWNEAKEMESGAGKIEDEMREAEEDIEGDQWKHESRRGDLGNQRAGSYPPESMEKHGRKQGSNGGLTTTKMRAKASWIDKTRSVCSLLFGPVFVQAFVLTFLAEWGDRSQIATIILGAAHNIYLVTAGTVLGHSCCTALAVVGGRYISTKISIKHVTYGGSVLFILFGLVYLYEGFAMSASDSLNLDMTIPIPMDMNI